MKIITKYKYNLLLIALSFFIFTNASAQLTGMGTRNPQASSLLDMDVSALPINGKKGFLPPRLNLLTNNDITTIPTPAKGLWVYNLSNASSASTAVFKGYTYVWNGTIWDYFSSRDEIIALKIPVEFVLSSKSTTATANLSTTIVPISWASGEILIDNTDIVATTLPSTNFTIKKAGIYEFSGNISYNPAIMPELTSTTLILALQVQTGGVWTTFASNQVVFGHGEVNTIQSIPFPKNLRSFQVNDLVRMVVVKSSGDNHGSTASINARLTTYNTKSLRITYIAQ